MTAGATAGATRPNRRPLTAEERADERACVAAHGVAAIDAFAGRRLTAQERAEWGRWAEVQMLRSRVLGPRALPAGARTRTASASPSAPHPPEDPEGLARWRAARALRREVHADALDREAARTAAVLQVHGRALARARLVSSLTAAGNDPDPAMARLYRARARYLQEAHRAP